MKRLGLAPASFQLWRRRSQSGMQFAARMLKRMRRLGRGVVRDIGTGNPTQYACSLQQQQ